MKRVLYLLTAILLLVSCQDQNRYDQVIARADSLMESNQDSARAALGMLDGIKPHYADMGKRQQMYYQLIYAKGMNKGFVDFTTDSVMRQVAAYYDKHGSANDKMLAYYLLGCTYRDLKDSPASLANYNKAVECADTTSNICNYNLLAIINGQIGSLLLDQGMPDLALGILDKVKLYANKSKDTVLYLQAMAYQANAYYRLGNKQKFLKIKEELFYQYSKLGMKQDAALSLCSTICEYVNKSQLAKAKHLMDLYEQKSGLMDAEGNVSKGKEIYLDTKGDFYLKCHQLELATAMFQKLLQSTSLIDEKEKAYRGLTKVYREKCQIDSMAKYALLAQEANDSTFRKMSTATLIKMQALYNYDQAEHKSQALENANKTLKYRNNGILIGVFFIVIVGIVFVLQQRAKFKLKMKLREEHLQVQIMHYLRDNQELVEAKRKLAKLLSQEKATQKNIKSKYEQRIMELERRILFFETPSSVTESLRVDKILQTSSIRQELDKKAAIGVFISEDEIERAKILLAEKTPNLFALISHSTLLTDKQIAICMLVRLGFTAKDIQALLDISSGYASNAKRNISKKMFGKELSPKDFDVKIRKML